MNKVKGAKMSEIDLAYLPVIGRGEQINIICAMQGIKVNSLMSCLLYTSPSPRDKRQSRMPSSA